jgi:hypothetical protein
MVSLPVGSPSVPDTDVGGGDESPLDVESESGLELDETEAALLAVMLISPFPVVSLLWVVGPGVPVFSVEASSLAVTPAVGAVLELPALGFIDTTALGEDGSCGPAASVEQACKKVGARLAVPSAKREIRRGLLEVISAACPAPARRSRPTSLHFRFVDRRGLLGAVSPTGSFQGSDNDP